MDNIRHFPTNFCSIAIFSCFVIFSAKETAVSNTVDSRLDNSTSSGQYREEGEKTLIHSNSANIRSEERILDCPQFQYNSTEFDILPNKSALLYGQIIPPEEYQLEGNILSICEDHNEHTEEDTDYKNLSANKCVNQTNDSTSERVLIRVGQIGSGISIIALIIYLLIFCIVPSSRGLPGYNLASLSVAFILAYSFHLIGQIPQVLGLFCVVSGVLQLNFFLTAFFCMNVLAFDVWRTLKFATSNLAGECKNPSKRQFFWYSLYSWGCPLIISIFSVICDNSDIVPDNFKPKYGECDICSLTSVNARIIFFIGPAFTMITINAFFFITSFWMICRDKVTFIDDQNNQTVKFFLYLRLGVMMGMTWFIAIFALIFNNEILWFVSDLVNSLQGLFLFLLFICRRKVMQQLKEKMNCVKSSSEKEETTALSNSSNLSSKNRYCLDY